MSMFEVFTRHLFQFVNESGLGPNVVRPWTEDDPQLMNSLHEGIFTPTAEPPAGKQRRYALLLHLRSDAHDPTCNEEETRVSVLFEHHAGPSRIAGLNNNALHIRKIFVNGEERYAAQLPDAVTAAMLERCLEVIPVKHAVGGKSQRWVARYTSSETPHAPMYWTGRPTQPWSFEIEQAYNFVHEDDARLMADVLARSSAVIGPSDKTAVYGHEGIYIDSPRRGLH